MNQLTKGVVIASTLVAALVELYLATTPLLGIVLAIALGGFAISAALGTRYQRVLTPVILFAVYLTPAAYVLFHGYEHFSLDIVWSLPLLGLVVSGRQGWRWSLPSPWRWPLVAWSLFVAVSWPIVFLREIDFDFGMLSAPIANTGVGISPWESGLAITYAVLVHNIGLLWIDALFRWYANGGVNKFRDTVLFPLAAALVIASVVGMVQAFVALGFLNPHSWPHMGRASGTLGDANVFGSLSALWGPAFIVLARTLPAPWSLVVGAGGLGFAAMGVFTSGSRTALIALGIGVIAMAHEGIRLWRSAGTRAVATRVVTFGIGVGAFAVVLALMARDSSLTTVIDRGSLRFIPGIGELGVREAAWELWDRFGYGSAAVQMIREHPWAGVGVGSFHTLVHDFAMVVSGKDIPPDNAQNWYRHLLAELGLLGSLPWIAWCVLFVSTLFSRGTSSRDRFAPGVLRGSLVGFGIVSLLGMPGQSLPVVLTFWTLMFWYVSLKDAPVGPRGSTTGAWSTITWSATLALVAIHAVITYADARGDLLPRNRSTRFGWDYQYGISDPERHPDGSPGRRWTERKSFSVIPVRGKVLKFVGWIDHPDADERPVRVRVWADSKMVYDDDLRRSAAIFLDIPATAGKTHMEVRTEISRTWTPRDFGRDDSRELGLSVRDWVWQ